MIDIQVNGALPALGAGESYVWVQGLEVDYNIMGNIVAPYYVMDTATLSNLTCPTAVFPVTVCAPLYPYQNGGNAASAISSINLLSHTSRRAPLKAGSTSMRIWRYKTRPIRLSLLLDGVNYGFYNYVSPEPGSWMLMAGGIGAALFFRRRVRVNG